MNPSIYGQPCFPSGAEAIRWGEGQPFQQTVPAQLDSHVHKMNLELFVLHATQKN